MAAMGLRIPVFCMLFSLSLAVVSVALSAPAPAPATDCLSLVLNIADCLSFVRAGSTTKKPDSTCCSSLKTMLKIDAECLCEAFRNIAQLGVTLNMSKSIILPSACHVSTPSVSNCGLSIGTDAAPAVSPSLAVSPSTDAGAPIAPEIGANEIAPAPAPDSGSSGSWSLTTSIELFLLTVVSFALL